MNILIASDKYKNSLTSEEVNTIIANAILSQDNTCQIKKLQIADGGDGTLEAIYSSQPKKWDKILITSDNTISDEPNTEYYLSDGTAAIIEMAMILGLKKVQDSGQSVMTADTYIIGDYLKDAIEKKHSTIILTVGGSGTNDAALGVARYFGFKFFDQYDKLLEGVTQDMAKIKKYQGSNPFIGINLQIITDVTNQFYGKNGAAVVYAPQKGANPDQVSQLDKGLENLAKVIEQHIGLDLQLLPGAGAAGGIAGGMAAFFGAKLHKGIDFLAQAVELETNIAWADIVITGEGKVDEQSIQGKVIDGIAYLVQQHNKRMWIVAGSCSLKPQELQTMGVEKCSTIMSNAIDLHDAMLNAKTYLQDLVIKMIN